MNVIQYIMAFWQYSMIAGSSIMLYHRELYALCIVKRLYHHKTENQT